MRLTKLIHLGIVLLIVTSCKPNHSSNEFKEKASVEFSKIDLKEEFLAYFSEVSNGINYDAFVLRKGSSIEIKLVSSEEKRMMILNSEISENGVFKGEFHDLLSLLYDQEQRPKSVSGIISSDNLILKVDDLISSKESSVELKNKFIFDQFKSNYKSYHSESIRHTFNANLLFFDSFGNSETTKQANETLVNSYSKILLCEYCHHPCFHTKNFFGLIPKSEENYDFTYEPHIDEDFSSSIVGFTDNIVSIKANNYHNVHNSSDIICLDVLNGERIESNVQTFFNYPERIEQIIAEYFNQIAPDNSMGTWEDLGFTTSTVYPLPSGYIFELYGNFRLKLDLFVPTEIVVQYVKPIVNYQTRQKPNRDNSGSNKQNNTYLADENCEFATNTDVLVYLIGKSFTQKDGGIRVRFNETGAIISGKQYMWQSYVALGGFKGKVKLSSIDPATPNVTVTLYVSCREKAITDNEIVLFLD